MDSEGKTKTITMLQIKLPHHNGIDNLRVKVDNGAEANILLLDSFRTMFPDALTNEATQREVSCTDLGPTLNAMMMATHQPWEFQTKVSKTL